MQQHVGELAVYSTLVIQGQSPFSAEMFAQYGVLRHATERCQQIIKRKNDYSMTDNIRHNRGKLGFASLLYCF